METRLEIEFPAFEQEQLAPHVAEVWKFADGSTLYKVEGRWSVELPKFQVIETTITFSEPAS
jgi:hypothetical protein